MRWITKKKESEPENERRLGSHGKATLAALFACVLLVSALSISFLNSASSNSSTAGTGDDLSPGSGTDNTQIIPPPFCAGNPPPRPDEDETGSCIVVEPRLVWLDVNVTQQFTAQAYVDNESISNLTYTWSVETLPPPFDQNATIQTVGTIDQNGLFTATANGMAIVTAETEYNGTTIVGHAIIMVGNPPPPQSHGPGPRPPCPPHSGDMNQLPGNPHRGGGGNPPPPRQP